MTYTLTKHLLKSTGKGKSIKDEAKVEAWIEHLKEGNQ